jgi:acid phosphatase (class A)|tara:strand:- start:274 stop:1125 length:852 start_codon:yes stop_codon:yes gene_type:complete
MKPVFPSLLVVVLVTCLSACSTIEKIQSMATGESAAAERQVKEIMPGFLEGYLPRADQLDSKVFVLPSPAKNSARQALDNAWAESMQSLRGTPRWALAVRDANLTFPAPADVFSCAMGIPVNEEDTPALYMLLWRTMTDIGLAPYSAKNAYQRARPFMVREESVCTPQDEEILRKDGSYPSGHTSIGWGWALILTELLPDRAEAILARGRSFGESRNVCNAHWYSDVVAGRLTGAAAVAKLHANDEFLAAMDAARSDVERARAADLTPNIDCEAEAKALSTQF